VLLSSKKSGFTMIELVFVIVVLGILAGIAIPRLAATRDDAQIAKGRSDVAAIRAGIVSERQTRLLKGETNYATTLEGADNSVLFEKVMQYGITPKTANGHWRQNNTSYIFQIMGSNVTFDYNGTTGKFDCTHTDANCKLLTE
jgi:general secretion pathway protein G